MINNISIIGMGALGLLYADQITTGLNNPDIVEFVMDDERAKRHKEDIYTINGIEKKFRITEAKNATEADLVIVAVKYTALKDALDVMTNCVGDNTIIISVLNGVNSEKIISERYGMDRIVYTVAQGMDAMRDGTSLKYTQCGNLHIGSTNEKMKNNLESVKELFERAKVPHIVEEDIMYRLWFKYMLNIGINQTCMVYDTNYGYATTEGTEPYEKMVGAMKEVIDLAAKKGINLTMKDLNKCIEIEKTLDPEGYPSMAQDRKANRKSEVDMFAGELIRMANECGTSSDYNKYFYNRVMEIESRY